MRIAAFNVENLFDRAKALNFPTDDPGRQVLNEEAELNGLLNQAEYSPDDKARMVELLMSLGLGADDDGPLVLLRRNRGHLLKRSGGEITIVANGRADFIGWVELKTEQVNELATRHTAMVVREVAPDVLAVVEAENRVALKRFSDFLLPSIGAKPFEHVMLVDGNDDRGIDVGIATRQGFAIDGIRSHVDDADGSGTVFSRDCPEFAITTPAGERLVVLVNHLKSKGFGSQAANDAKRARQARRIAEIYNQLVEAGQTNIVVLGDFNDTPDSPPLAPLLADTDLRDISLHPSFVSDGRPGTFENGTKGDKIDYVLLSPALFDRVTGGGVFRKGVWGGKHGQLFPHFETMTQHAHAASDHAAIFADIDF
jgi:endonuclease/exonuclease/phosphatase family metal-dependent hydrolase